MIEKHKKTLMQFSKVTQKKKQLEIIKLEMLNTCTKQNFKTFKDVNGLK